MAPGPPLHPAAASLIWGSRSLRAPVGPTSCPPSGAQACLLPLTHRERTERCPLVSLGNGGLSVTKTPPSTDVRSFSVVSEPQNLGSCAGLPAGALCPPLPTTRSPSAPAARSPPRAEPGQHRRRRQANEAPPHPAAGVWGRLRVTLETAYSVHSKPVLNKDKGGSQII